MATPDKDGFTLVKGGRKSKKRKADGFPLPHSPPGASSASPINTPALSKPSTYKNSVPIILKDVDPKFNSVIKLMSELRHFHPSRRVSKVQELKNNRCGGGVRLCIAYREIGIPYRKFKRHLTRVGGNSWFSTLDQGKAYHQEIVKQSGQRLTALIMPWGLYEW